MSIKFRKIDNKFVINFREELLRLQFGRYQNTNMISLQLYTTGDYPEPYMTASFNPDLGYLETEFELLPRRAPMKSDWIAIKDWSENHGIEQALLDNSVLIKNIGSVQAGYCKGNIYEINKEFLGDE